MTPPSVPIRMHFCLLLKDEKKVNSDQSMAIATVLEARGSILLQCGGYVSALQDVDEAIALEPGLRLHLAHVHTSYFRLQCGGGPITRGV